MASPISRFSLVEREVMVQSYFYDNLPLAERRALLSAWGISKAAVYKWHKVVFGMSISDPANAGRFGLAMLKRHIQSLHNGQPEPIPKGFTELMLSAAKSN